MDATEDPQPWAANNEYTKQPDCEQWPVCPQCGETRIVRNGWLYCDVCLYAELLPQP